MTRSLMDLVAGGVSHNVEIYGSDADLVTYGKRPLEDDVDTRMQHMYK